ncbi:LLM class flavin-dependent oxidoreductase [Nonomuraea endophytica]|uniref:Alkanesulfonate monooxygenase SsuD/methylene tetrahydromethanopterin reductase-like flavin-dependent oxidoreductase (Luciferase family) n=1 Tax=Nonomuraea endophytica TaxID=714136 RepID=A0A7W8A3P4_9ACTN|nr:LLM class flavin-dependent oxidoreductase [Nonomuraea endophytica]MBB5078929.1 alkanesulfonate monooxygenase SsuD/methylene tetrahydromethanopterin reductase-like flavin-dependent oxidoreductase (luciferase family) [Nonomuraea endophytica]
MRITYGPWGETLAELAEAARAAEEAGAEVVWLPELHRSATVTAAAVAPVLSRAGVGTAVALAFTRSPLTLALEALDLDELTGGRFVLGLGVGARRLNERWHHVAADRPVTRLRETVEIIRAVVAGTPPVVEGETRRADLRGFRRPHRPVRAAIPIYLAAVGPQLTRLAGRIADGWISHELCSPAYVREHVLPNLCQATAPAKDSGVGSERGEEPGARVRAGMGLDGSPGARVRAGMGLDGSPGARVWAGMGLDGSPGVRGGAGAGLDGASGGWVDAGVGPQVGSGLDVVVSACCAIDADPAEARRQAKGVLGFYASVATYRDFFAFHGLAEEQEAVIEAFRAGTPADGLAAAVPDRMVERLALAGTPTQVAAGIDAYRGLATTIKLTPPVYGRPPEAVRESQARIIALIKELT